MNVKRFTARTSREALALVKQAFGDDAVVMSTRPCADGVEVVAMTSESVLQLERVSVAAELPAPFADSASAAEMEEDDEALAPSWMSPERSAATRLAAARQVAVTPPAVQAPAPAPGPRPRSALQAALGAMAAATRSTLRPRLEPSLDHAAPVRSHAAAADSGLPSKHSTREVRAAEAERSDRSVHSDVKALEMSTLSFQDYVRQRMFKRRAAEEVAAASAQVQPVEASVVSPIEEARKRLVASHRHALSLEGQNLPVLQDEMPLEAQIRPTYLDLDAAPGAASDAVEAARADRRKARLAQAAAFEPATPSDIKPSAVPDAHALAQQQREQVEMMSELRSMRGLIEQRFGALAFMEKLQRQPRQAQLAQRLMEAGFSPSLIRRLVDGLPSDVEEMAWASSVLERNLHTAEREPALEDQGGIYAMVGTTGVGKTTSTAKLAAAFASRHGAGNLGLVTLDAYRVGAHEQLRTYGRILGVPVHTAHDRASLEDLLDLLAGKRMVLIDTAGMAQRDSRTRELLEMVSHSAIKRLLVINASAQGETIEDQLAAYAAQSCCGVVLSKLDEAVKLGPALDSMVRHKLKVLAVANGQRVPEDWHRLSSNALVQRALRGGGSSAWKLDGSDVNLVFASMPHGAPDAPAVQPASVLATAAA